MKTLIEAFQVIFYATAKTAEIIFYVVAPSIVVIGAFLTGLYFITK